MKLALMSDAWKPQINGVVTTLDNTAKNLTKQGYQVELITPEQFTNWPCPTYPAIRLALGCGSKVNRILSDYQPDIVHIATEGPIGLAGRRYCLKHKLRFTTSLHTLFPEYVHLRFGLPIKWGYRLLRWFHHPASATMVTTETMRRLLKERGFSHLKLWSRGVNTELFHPQRQRLWDDSEPVYMYVGRVAIEKNIEDFLKLKLAGKKVVVGDGPQRQQLQARFPKVDFVGFQSGEALADYMASADVLVFPSRTDTFGIVMLDALASGVPVAAYPVQGPIDVIKEQAVGCLDDNLEHAVKMASTLKRQDCRVYAEQYSWENCTQQFIHNLVNCD